MPKTSYICSRVIPGLTELRPSWRQHYGLFPARLSFKSHYRRLNEPPRPRLSKERDRLFDGASTPPLPRSRVRLPPVSRVGNRQVINRPYSAESIFFTARNQIDDTPEWACLLPAAASSTAPGRVGVGRLDAFCAQIHDDDAVRLEAVRKQRRGYPAASGFALALLDHLQRALIRQRRNRGVAERERGGQGFDQLRLRRFLLVALCRARVRHALDSGAV